MMFFALPKKLDGAWKDWFAWFPVCVEPAANCGYARMWIWLETVERKKAIWYSGDYWRYREKVVTPNVK